MKKFIKTGFIGRFKNVTLMIYIIHEMLVLLKNQLNYLKDSIFKCLFKEYNRFFLLIFFTTYNDGQFKS